MLWLAAALPAQQPQRPQQPEPGQAALPATDLNRESNNPAKAAIKAKEALDKEHAERNAAANQSAASEVGPVADTAQLVDKVAAALRNDVRTAKLGIAVQLDDEKLIGLHGMYFYDA
jgi:hypothetical protein